MIDFILPLIFAIVGGNKWFCNNMCGRGQLFWVLGRNLKCSRKKQAPKWISSKYFRYGFLVFFLTMFGTMVFQTYMVFSGAQSLRKAIKLFWTFRVPWKWAYNGSIFPDWVAQFGFGFYSLMLTSTLIGLIVGVIIIGAGYIRGEVTREYQITSSFAIITPKPTDEKTKANNIQMSKGLTETAIYIVKSEKNIQSVVENLGLRGVSAADISKNLTLTKNGTEKKSQSAKYSSVGPSNPASLHSVSAT